MNLPDVNVWLALVLSGHEFHVTARRWFTRQSARGSILFCRMTQQSFLRLLTTESVMRLYGLAAKTNADAWDVYQAFVAHPHISWAGEPRGLEARWNLLSRQATASPKLWMDSYLAAFALASGHRIVTTDKAFSQFQKLNPVILGSEKPNASR